MKIEINNFNWKIGGAAGYGILSAGEIFAYSCLRAGLETFAYLEYPSLIKGGHNTYQIWAREDNVQSHSSQIDLLIALDQQTIKENFSEIVPGGGLIYDLDDRFLENFSCPRKDINCFGIPLQSLAEQSGGQKIMSNVVATAASLALVKLPFDIIVEFIKKALAKKGPIVVEQNIKAARAGYDYVKEKFADKFDYELKSRSTKEKRMLINGNEAISLGALKAGMKFFAAYPMTPATSILHYLAANETNYNLVVKQTEDEIAAINMIIGAGYAGVRSMTATSGGGFALMAEGLGLAGMTETPCVIVVAQRPGPATGLPTWTEQGDLRFVMHAGQGDFPRVVLAPGDTEECFYMTFEAFNIADLYQLPVIILTDKYLAEARQTLPFFNQNNLKINRGEYGKILDDLAEKRLPRYFDTNGGVSPRFIPGIPGGVFLANSDEHEATGLDEESAALRIAMMNKRMRKLQSVKKDIKESVTIYGPKKADITLVGWGSTKGSILEAMKLLNVSSSRLSDPHPRHLGHSLRHPEQSEGSKETLRLKAQNDSKATINFLQIKLLEPFPVKEVDAILRQAKHRILIENNFSGQLGGLIRERTGIDITDKLLKYDGRPIHPEEIVDFINSK